MNKLENMISETGIVPVIKLSAPEQNAKPLAEALMAGDVFVAEVTFRTSGAAEAIHLITGAYSDMIVGAGTILTTRQAQEAIAAGASFIVTPGFDPEIVALCKSKNIPIFPGCTTATDYHAAYRAGLSLLKFFPAAQSGGIAKIKALSAPFPMFKVMPTGGINLGNLREYVSCPVVAACGGSYMVTSELIDNGRWGDITQLCLKSREIIKEARCNG